MPSDANGWPLKQGMFEFSRSVCAAKSSRPSPQLEEIRFNTRRRGPALSPPADRGEAEGGQARRENKRDKKQVSCRDPG